MQLTTSTNIHRIPKIPLNRNGQNLNENDPNIQLQIDIHPTKRIQHSNKTRITTTNKEIINMYKMSNWSSIYPKILNYACIITMSMF